MNNNFEFKCLNADEENIPKELIKKLGMNSEGLYCNMEKMITLALSIKTYNNDSICRLPFSTTIEAESLGAQIKFCEDNIQSRINGYIINKIEDIYSMNEMKFISGSIVETLKTVKYLSSAGEKVCLSVEGPMTVANQLMNSNMFYRSLIKERSAIDYLLKIIEDGILTYIKAALQNGAAIISYADPSGNIDILGPRLYNEYSGKINYEILKRSEEFLDNALIHICGRTSSSLEACNLAKKYPVDMKSEMSFSQVLLDTLEHNKAIKYVGNGCIKRSYIKDMNNKLWEIKLKE